MNIICMCMPIHLFQITIDTILLLCVLVLFTHESPTTINLCRTKFYTPFFYSLNNHEKIFMIDMYVKVNNNLQHEKFIS